MQKWEYQEITTFENKVRYVNGQELRDWKKGPHYMVYLNQLGMQGWELVAPYSAQYGFSQHGFERYILKRLVP